MYPIGCSTFVRFLDINFLYRYPHPHDTSCFLDIPTDSEMKHRYRLFYDAASNDSLWPAGFCHGRSVEMFHLQETAWTAHPAHVLHHGLLLEPLATERRGDGLYVQICRHFVSDLRSGDLNCPPKRSLANNLWIGCVPDVSKRLSFPQQHWSIQESSYLNCFRSV